MSYELYKAWCRRCRLSFDVWALRDRGRLALERSDGLVCPSCLFEVHPRHMYEPGDEPDA